MLGEVVFFHNLIHLMHINSWYLKSQAILNGEEEIKAWLNFESVPLSKVGIYKISFKKGYYNYDVLSNVQVQNLAFCVCASFMMQYLNC